MTALKKDMRSQKDGASRCVSLPRSMPDDIAMRHGSRQNVVYLPGVVANGNFR
jgi:hypothetical protein